MTGYTLAGSRKVGASLTGIGLTSSTSVLRKPCFELFEGFRNEPRRLMSMSELVFSRLESLGSGRSSGLGPKTFSLSFF